MITSRPILNGPLTVRKSAPANYQADMPAFHLALPAAYPDIYHTFDMGSGTARHVNHQRPADTSLPVWYGLAVITRSVSQPSSEARPHAP
jgi:hypothetical protein